MTFLIWPIHSIDGCRPSFTGREKAVQLGAHCRSPDLGRRGASGPPPLTSDMQTKPESAAPPDEEPDDELDALLDSYTQQAAAETSAMLKQQAANAKGSRKAVAIRERGLQTALAQDNKGFQLLQKMGYSPGAGLGSSTQGRVEPVPVQLKAGRTGLGVDEARRAQKRQAEEEALQQAAKRQQQAVHHLQQFQEHRATAYALRKARGQLHSAQQACLALDEQAGIEHNPLLQQLGGEEAEEAAEGQQPMPATRAAEATGVAAAAADHGNTEDAGYDTDDVVPGARSMGNLEQQPQQPAVNATLPDALAALEKLLRYMRSQHLYCLYCGCRYDDTADMEANCPGMFEEDHE